MGVLIFIGLLAAPVGMIFFGWRALNLYLQSRGIEKWKRGEGTIQESRIIDEYRGRYYLYRPKVTYLYKTEGRTWQGSRIAFSVPAFTERHKAEDYLALYPEGRNARVYYNPKKPRDVTIDPTLPTSQIVGNTLAAIICVGILIFIFANASEIACRMDTMCEIERMLNGS